MVWIFLLAGNQSSRAQSTPVNWSSTIGKNHLTSNNAAMDESFRFQIGYFESTIFDEFVPTSANTSEWLARWRPVQSVNYSPSLKYFASQFNVPVESYDAQFQKAYVWGYSGNEWILFSDPDWIWPDGGIPDPLGFVWTAKQATEVILGEIIPSETPHLLKSATVTNSQPPDTPWALWQEQYFGAGPNSGPTDDADGDGANNLLEFVMGTDPKKSGGIPATPSEIITLSTDRYLQITIPRRIDRPATLIVEVASSPAGPWSSGAAHTTTVSDTINSLIVRDNIAISPSHPHRFMRLRVVLP